jgi:hypothetical protein
MTVELTVTASRSVDGKAAFKVPFVEVELGAGRTWGRAQTSACPWFQWSGR